MYTASDLPARTNTDASGASSPRASSTQPSLGIPGILRVLFRNLVCAVSPSLLLAVALCPAAQATSTLPTCPQKSSLASPAVARAALSYMDTAISRANSTQPAAASAEPLELRKLIVIGFMGGSVQADNFVHREATMARDLEQRHPLALHAAVFANRDGDAALAFVLQHLDKDENGCLSANEKSTARIVIYGHSWGASEAVTLAGRLDKLGIPVLLTIQVDSVQKPDQNDRQIPPNVREAVNFYQSEGLLRGRSLIVAVDPAKTRILGNRESSYRRNPISVAGFPWYARAFMRRHIQIENDPQVWNQIEALIVARLF